MAASKKDPGWHHDYGRASSDHCLRFVEHSTCADEPPASKTNFFRQGGLCKLIPPFAKVSYVTFFGLKLLPLVLPGLKNVFSWVPFWWGFFIICVADDLTQYWYHRLHHQVPWLWRFHRMHHSAAYMGMSMASRQNAFYTIFF